MMDSNTCPECGNRSVYEDDLQHRLHCDSCGLSWRSPGQLEAAQSQATVDARSNLKGEKMDPVIGKHMAVRYGDNDWLEIPCYVFECEDCHETSSLAWLGNVETYSPKNVRVTCDLCGGDKRVLLERVRS